MMPDFVNHLLHLKVSVLLLHVMLLLLLGEKLCASCPEGKSSMTSSFLYHRACKIVNVIRQARPETMDCHAAQYYRSLVLLSVPVPTFCLIIYVGCRMLSSRVCRALSNRRALGCDRHPMLPR